MPKSHSLRSFPRKLLRLLMVLAIAICAGVLCVVFAPRERLLLRQAYLLPLSSTTFFSGHDPYGMGDWRSNHEQLLLRHVPGTAHDTVWVRDVYTNTETLLQPFNDRFSSELKRVPRRIAINRVNRRVNSVSFSQQWFSPNGKWLLWQQGQTWRAFALDGSRQYQWPLDPQETPYRRAVRWSFDGQMWLEPHYDNQFRINGALLHRVEGSAPEGVRTFADSAGQWLLGVTREHHLLTQDNPGSAGGPYEFYDTALEPDHAATRKIAIHLPEKAILIGTALSPDGSRLLWNLQVQHDVPGPRFLQTLLGWFGMKAHLQNGLWVSNIDGNDMREVGHVNIAPFPSALTAVPTARFPITQQITAQFQRLYGVQWLADSKHALFMRGNNVYEVDVK